MRKQKVRGHNRRHKQIEKWRSDNLSVDLGSYLLNDRDRYYVKIRINPWNGFSRGNSAIRQPAGKTKQQMLNGLLDIYENWKKQLNKLDQPYYLKIWLFEPHFLESQVVCAVGDRIHFYENSFFKPDIDKSLPIQNYGDLSEKLSGFHWDYHHDENRYDNTDLGGPEEYLSQQDYKESVRWFDKLMKKPHRTDLLAEPIGEITEVYSFKRGDAWLGGQ
jgi:hypothetical protein